MRTHSLFCESRLSVTADISRCERMAAPGSHYCRPCSRRLAWRNVKATGLLVAILAAGVIIAVTCIG